MSLNWGGGRGGAARLAGRPAGLMKNLSRLSLDFPKNQKKQNKYVKKTRKKVEKNNL